MKAPDKIYINNYNGNDTWGSQWHTKPAIDPVTISHEYIRKDALMELLKPEKDISFPDDYERGCIDGRNGLRGELIDKLNSM